ncbi:hypothetical protein CGZ75_12595 [Paenibacillus herberti]|uniref:Uncharacterized protein n=1 Tax=Paenibacillus herberti TaxID=1619309 RepID=A0A229P5J6_9BACL|nr:hypothetical protein CGZ75_12595 [Paenibacillus herberti]
MWFVFVRFIITHFFEHKKKRSQNKKAHQRNYPLDELILAETKSNFRMSASLHSFIAQLNIMLYTVKR